MLENIYDSLVKVGGRRFGLGPPSFSRLVWGRTVLKWHRQAAMTLRTYRGNQNFARDRPSKANPFTTARHLRFCFLAASATLYKSGL